MYFSIHNFLFLPFQAQQKQFPYFGLEKDEYFITRMAEIFHSLLLIFQYFYLLKSRKSILILKILRLIWYNFRSYTRRDVYKFLFSMIFFFFDQNFLYSNRKMFTIFTIEI